MRLRFYKHDVGFVDLELGGDGDDITVSFSILYLVDLRYVGRFVADAGAGCVIVPRVIVASVRRVETLGTAETVAREREELRV